MEGVFWGEDVALQVLQSVVVEEHLEDSLATP